MRRHVIFIGLFCVALVVGVLLTRERWLPLIAARPVTAKAAEPPAAPIQEAKVLKLSAEARQNLGLVVKRIKPETYWRTIQVPGVIVDRPGRSDRGVTAPAVGVVTQVHAFPGDTVKPGERLVTLRVFSEYLQNSQSELFKATRETQLVKEQQARLKNAAESGALPQARLVELEQQQRRLAATIQAHRQDLLTRGFNPEQIESVAGGEFVTTIDVVAPPSIFRFLIDDFRSDESDPVPHRTQPDNQQSTIENQKSKMYEVQELKVELGQQVQAGQLLAVLSNHHSLYIEGHAFKQEAPFLEQATQNEWLVQVEFAEDDSAHWPTLDQKFEIRHLANSIDPMSRTFDFYIPLTNQSRGYEKDGQTFVVWRFRPGQRVRLNVPVEEMKDVFVLPAAAIVREGPEAYVFGQNGDLFNRKPVHVLYEDRLNVVIAKTENITPGLYLAQNGAASLNRVLKAQAASGAPVGVHVHADGTVHGAH